MPSTDDLRSLALHEPAEAVLSVYARTDARDPANTNHVPGWLIALRNGLRAIGKESRFSDLAELLERVEREAAALAPADRGRSFAWFLTPDATLDRRFTLQIPVRTDLVVLDDRPFVSPLVDVVDRGRPAVVVLVGSETVRLLHWKLGRIIEPEDSTRKLSLGDWREYRGPAAAGPARGQQTATHAEHFEARVEDRRRKFIDSAAGSITRRIEELGIQRVVIAGEGQVARAFADALGPSVEDRIVDVLDFNANDALPADIGSVVEPVLEAHWRREAEDAAVAAFETARAGGPAAAGPDETLAALVDARVERLFLDAERPYAVDGLGPHARQAFDARTTCIAEGAVELAIAGGADVTAVGSGCAPVAEAGGMVARLRY